jgi:hypothetical protein
VKPTDDRDSDATLSRAIAAPNQQRPAVPESPGGVAVRRVLAGVSTAVVAAGVVLPLGHVSVMEPSDYGWGSEVDLLTVGLLDVSSADREIGYAANSVYVGIALIAALAVAVVAVLIGLATLIRPTASRRTVPRVVAVLLVAAAAGVAVVVDRRMGDLLPWRGEPGAVVFAVGALLFAVAMFWPRRPAETAPAA